jgi:hypothetical protein
LEQASPEYKDIRVSLLDGIQDLAEVIDGLTGDLRDFTGYHVGVMKEMEETLSLLKNRV